MSAVPQPAAGSQYADCIEAIRARLAAREARLFGIGVLIVYVHQVERLFESTGPQIAARMLDELRNRLSQGLKPGDYFTRLGDRKFAFVLSHLRNQGHALLAVNKILRTGAEPLLAGGQHASLRLSVGVGMFPAHARHPEDLLQCAELALLDAWKTSQSSAVYTEGHAGELSAGWDLETQLATALERGELLLKYQPKIALADWRVVGAEALMRWNRPEAGNVPPDVFIDVAEMSGQIDPLTRFSFQRALRQLGEWPKSMNAFGVAVNVTPSIICNPALPEMLENIATACSADLKRLTLEVTENALLFDRDRSHEVLVALRERGVRVSIDDFGTGHTSLGGLKEIPADEIKIDKCFVLKMLSEKADRAVVEQAISLGHAFGLEVVAEGVESEAVAEELSRMRCDYAQGFHYARPLAPEDLSDWVREWRARL